MSISDQNSFRLASITRTSVKFDLSEHEKQRLTSAARGQFPSPATIYLRFWFWFFSRDFRIERQLWRGVAKIKAIISSIVLKTSSGASISPQFITNHHAIYIHCDHGWPRETSSPSFSQIQWSANTVFWYANHASVSLNLQNNNTYFLLIVFCELQNSELSQHFHDLYSSF